jgi:hypothetical protein
MVVALQGRRERSYVEYGRASVRLRTRQRGGQRGPTAQGFVLKRVPNTVGGSEAVLANVISGNRSDSVLITGPGTNRNVVRGNLIGTSSSGNAAAPSRVGVNITDGARFNTVGGSFNQWRGVISGNTSAGVRVAGAETVGNRIRGNHIGLSPSGVGARPNGVGVIVAAGAQGTTIGGAG